jgi:hypothetical protein
VATVFVNDFSCLPVELVGTVEQSIPQESPGSASRWSRLQINISVKEAERTGRAQQRGVNQTLLDASANDELSVRSVGEGGRMFQQGFIYSEAESRISPGDELAD